jgi:ABC-type lipoprotein export system ATPase subunit
MNGPATSARTQARGTTRERRTTFVFSTHDPRIMKAADRVLEISDGRLR